MSYYGFHSFKVEFYDPNTDRCFGYAPSVEIAIKTAILLSDDKTVQIRDKKTKQVLKTIVNGRVIIDK